MTSEYITIEPDIDVPDSITGTIKEFNDSYLGIKFLSRSDVTTKFQLNDNYYTNKEMNLAMKCLAFYTAALFQTDTMEQKIIYRSEDGEILIDTIINIIYKEIVADHIGHTSGIYSDGNLNNPVDLNDNFDPLDSIIKKEYRDRVIVKSVNKIEKCVGNAWISFPP